MTNCALLDVKNTNLIISGQIKRKLAKLNKTLIYKLSFHSFSLQNLQIENSIVRSVTYVKGKTVRIYSERIKSCTSSS